MSINKDNFDNHDLDIFDDDFEVIYEGDLPDIPVSYTHLTLPTT